MQENKKQIDKTVCQKISKKVVRKVGKKTRKGQDNKQLK